MFCQGGPIDLCTQVTDPFDQYSAESEYNAACNAGKSLAHFRMLNKDFLDEDPYVVPKQAPLIILDSKSAVCMANNCKYTKHTRHIAIIMHFVINGE